MRVERFKDLEIQGFRDSRIQKFKDLPAVSRKAKQPPLGIFNNWTPNNLISPHPRAEGPAQFRPMATPRAGYFQKKICALKGQLKVISYTNY